MAVEIKELVIRAIAVEKKEEPAPQTEKAALSQEQMEALVEQCIQQVLKVLERKNAK